MEEKDMAVKKKETKETKVNTAPVEVRVKEVDDKVALALKALDDYASFDQEKIDWTQLTEITIEAELLVGKIKIQRT